MRAEPRREAVRQHLDDASERVAVLLRVIDLGDHECRRRGVEAAERIGVQGVHVVRRRKSRARRNLHRTDRERVADQTDAELAEERTGDGAESERVPPSRARSHARGSDGASSKSYFCMPTRSACPGRGRVSGALRPRDLSVSSTGSGFMTSIHFGHSVLPMRKAIGLPRLFPWRTPPERVSSSCSNFMREPRP